MSSPPSLSPGDPAHLLQDILDSWFCNSGPRSPYLAYKPCRALGFASGTGTSSLQGALTKERLPFPGSSFSRLWLQMYQADTRRKILGYERQYRTSAERMAELRLQEDLHILKDAQVVGMTTTGRKVWRLTCSNQVHLVLRSRQMKENMVRAVASCPALGNS